MGKTTPLFRPLTPHALAEIDRAGRWILEHVGIRLKDPAFLRRLKSAGARIDESEQKIRFSPSFLDRQLALAPSQITLYSRDGRNDVHLGSGRVHFANGGRVFQILDLGTGGYRRTLLRDVAHTAALVDRLSHIDFYVIACQAHDVQPQHYHLNDFYHALNHTTKHVMGGCDDLDGVAALWELSCLVAGSEQRLTDRPFVSVITNPISPLTLDPNALRVFEFCCTRGLPVTCAPAPIAGATAPATLAGTLAQMHAEALAGVALSQVFAPGAKVLYGAVATAMDLRKMEFTLGSVEMALMNAAAVQLARRYNLPIYGSGGVTEAKRPDIQAGFEKSISSLMVAMAGADLLHLAAGMLDSGNSISYEQFVIDNEILGGIRRVLSGITVNESTLAREVISRVGPGGNFVTEDHTIDHMAGEFFYPALAVRSLFDVWEQAGRPSMLSRAREQVKAILEQRRDGVLDPDAISDIKKAFDGIQNI